jgi:hypothetical protein
MRKGFKAAVVLDKDGEIFAISTGSDAAAEHEGGSKPMQQALCQPRVKQPEPGMLGKLAQACGLAEPVPMTYEQLVSALRKGQPVTYPALIDRKAIRHSLDKLYYLVGKEKGEPVAVFGYSSRGPEAVRVDHGELQFYPDETYAGAWDEREFAFKVRGAEMVDKLKRFAERAQAGDAVFAGTFLEDLEGTRLSGVIVAVKSGMGPQHQVAIDKAQRDWEASLRLKARSRDGELMVLSRRSEERPHAASPGYIWPVWTKGPDSDVAYALNPGYQVKADYWGPYTFEELEKWILAETKYPLKPDTLRPGRAAA